jgi:hypothetical protein
MKTISRRAFALRLSDAFILLTATKAFAAVEALVTGAVAHCDMAAVRARGSILLEVRHGIAQVLDHLFGGRTVSMAVPVAGLDVEDIGILGNCQFRDGAIDLFSHLFQQTGHRQFRLITAHGIGFAVAGDKLQCQPAEDVVCDG